MSEFKCDYCPSEHECISCWHNRCMAEVHIENRGWTWKQSVWEGMYIIDDEVGAVLGFGRSLAEAYREALEKSGDAS